MLTMMSGVLYNRQYRHSHFCWMCNKHNKSRLEPSSNLTEHWNDPCESLTEIPLLPASSSIFSFHVTKYHSALRIHYRSFYDRDQIFLFPTSFTNTILFLIFYNSESFGKEGRKDDSILNTGRKEKKLWDNPDAVYW